MNPHTVPKAHALTWGGETLRGPTPSQRGGPHAQSAPMLGVNTSRHNPCHHSRQAKSASPSQNNEVATASSSSSAAQSSSSCATARLKTSKSSTAFCRLSGVEVLCEHHLSSNWRNSSGLLRATVAPHMVVSVLSAFILAILLVRET